MHSIVEILGKPVRVEWSKAADKALSTLSKPLSVEMELYFSCLIRKKVRFGDKAHSSVFVPVNERLGVAFRPVTTRTCSISNGDEEPPLDDFPIKNPAAFVPRWLKIDYRREVWVGEFGFDHDTGG